jgi:hypothetical protein
MKKKLKPSKPYWEMNTQELAEATRDLDGDIDPRRLKPLSPEMKALSERMKRKRGRPMVGKGSQVISLSIERELLKRSDELAKKEGLTRPQLFAQALQRMLRRRAG